MIDQDKKIRRLSVSIGGTTYHLVSDENDEYTREIARKADDAIRQILTQNTTLSNYQATVLALVNTMDAISRLSPAIAEAKNDVENANIRAKKAQDELFLVRDSEFELRKELMRINELNKQLELEIAALRQQQSIHPFDSRTFDIDKDMQSSLEWEPNPELNPELNPQPNPELNPEPNPELNPELNPQPNPELVFERDSDPEMETEPLNEAEYEDEDEKVENEDGISDIYGEYKQSSLEDLFS